MTSLIGYYIVHTQDPSKPASLGRLVNKNVTKNIKYKKQLGTGVLTLTASEVKLKSKEKILLLGIEADFVKSDKKITIECGECELNIKVQKAYLKKNVSIKSPGMICRTNEAIVDLKNNSIYGNSKITGKRGGDSFTASGFAIDRNGVIKLKKAVIKRKK